MKTLAELAPWLTHPRRIAVTHHYHPDADALGATLGLCHYLRRKGHTCKVISPDALPAFLHWMPDAWSVWIYEQRPEEADAWLQECDAVFCLDYNQLSRTHAMAPSLERFKGLRILMDHHLFPDPVFDYGLSDTHKSSTCEMVYDYINACGDNAMIDMDIAQCLYAGVMTDTGSFKFPCTTPGVHRLVADLMEKGLDTSAVHLAIFDTYEENRLRFLGFVLGEKMKIYPESHTALIAVTREESDRFHLKPGDTEGIVNYPLSLKNMVFSVFINEKEEGIRISFRSKGSFNVNEFARTFFEGGGHSNAAGGKSSRSMTETLQAFDQHVQQVQPQLLQCYEELI